MPERSEKLRRFFSAYLARLNDLRDERVVDAFAAVSRETFAGPGPWSILVPGQGYIQTPDDDPAFLYQDWLVALDAGRGINTGQPSLHSVCLEALRVTAGQSVLHVGAGTGYYTTILARLVGPTGKVVAYEIDPHMAARARDNLAGLPWVALHAASGAADDDLPKSDLVYVNAGTTHPNWRWLDALNPEGRLIFPLQAPDTLGAMLLVERPRRGGQSWPARFVARAGFIPCQGAQDEGTAPGLAAAFAGGGMETVRSLRIDDRPDSTCWFKGGGWWLSTAEADAR